MPPTHPRTIGIILARGGSKGIPRKNLRRLAGIPLIGRAVETLARARHVARVIVSTDDSVIAEVARAHGAETPFLRPPELALDTTPSMPALRHAVGALAAAGETAAIVVSFQATAPCCTSGDIAAALEEFAASTATHLKSVTRVREHPQWMGRIEAGRFHYLEATRARRRQDLPPLYRLNGAIHIYRCERVLAGTAEDGEPIAYELPAERSVDLDDEFDWQFAEALLAARTASDAPRE
ncbi:MAG: cytidylyltransferase domain-containing protein [Planctomycetota bacterium]